MSAPSPAQLLAAVLRVVAPGKVKIHGDIVRAGDEWFHPTSLSDLARVVAMLDGAQQTRFLRNLTTTHTTQDGDIQIVEMDAFEAITAPASTWLAAIVAATGAKA